MCRVCVSCVCVCLADLQLVVLGKIAGNISSAKDRGKSPQLGSIHTPTASLLLQLQNHMTVT